MKPSYNNLKGNHYSSNEYQQNYVNAFQLYEEIGYSLTDLLKANPTYQNTCAVRMSLTLLKSNVPFVGRMRIKEGVYKGKFIEPGAKLLADQLKKPNTLGPPALIDTNKPQKDLFGKKGIILFWKISGYGGGHIDLIEQVDMGQVCNSACYFSSKEIWFWPLH